MDRNVCQCRQSVEQLMPCIFCNRVTLTGWHLTINRDVKFCALTVPHPADGYIVDVHDVLHF